MRPSSIPTTLCYAALILYGFAFQIVSAYPGTNVLKPRRTSSILINPDAQPDLPTANQAASISAAASLNLSNIQGDILVGMKKKKELFYFFTIKDAQSCKTILGSDAFQSNITTVTQLLSVDTQPVTTLNIAFSKNGLTKLNVIDLLGDSAFSAGQAADAAALGDPGTANWIPALAGPDLDGLILLASDTQKNVDAKLTEIQTLFGLSLVAIYRLRGEARPGSEEGHEHFGFVDGISQPAVKGFTASPTSGQMLVDPGIFLLGETGDTITRPAWTKDGSFLAFRQLKQLVPEFNKFLADNPISHPSFTSPAQGSDLLGARMIGRWKSGAPVDLAPLFDDPVLGADPDRNNDFTFAHPGEDLHSNQTRCPFSAHIRKTNPRADLNPPNTIHHILRSGIPYGPEVSPNEAASNTSSGDVAQERGLAFVSYQSNLNNGFRFIQKSWANNPKFIFGKSDPTPGVDPIIGAQAGTPRMVSGLDPNDPDHDMTLVQDFVVSRGGGYFFSPSLSAIKSELAV